MCYVCSPRASDVLGQAAENRDGRERLVCVLAWSGAKSLASRAGVAVPACCSHNHTCHSDSEPMLRSCDIRPHHSRAFIVGHCQTEGGRCQK